MNQKKYSNIRFDIDNYDNVKPDILTSFKYEYKNQDIWINLETHEFSAVCPWSGLPDYGKLIIKYIPDDIILELKSFKFYLYTYRSVGIYQEHAANMIFNHIYDFLKPKKMKLELTYNIRGGIGTTVTKEK